MSRLPVEGIGLDMIPASKREFESCAMNAATLNLLMSPRLRARAPRYLKNVPKKASQKRGACA
jgi:hypothetical protein